MMANETRQLLRQFTREHSEAAFRELVRVHSPVVYGTALRMLGGDRAAAQDVTQEVFTLLVRKAADLDEVVLSAWLYRQACRRASNLMRTESRRKQRELVAAEMMQTSALPEKTAGEILGGEVDAALLTLPSADRDALVLRYFEGQNYRKLGSFLGTTEDAARKRVTRAIEKLAAALQQRGLAVGTTSLGATMASLGSTVPAPVISQITAHALKAVPAAGWSGLASLLKPFLTGVILSAFAAGTALAMQARRQAAAPLPPVSAESVDKDPASGRLLGAETSFDDLIAEIKRTNAGPKHSLTKLRIGAILEKISIPEIGGFILLAHDKLTPAEQAACFEPLLGRWLSADPAAAMDFVLTHEVTKAADKVSHTNMKLALFSKWGDRERAAAQEWLLGSWDAGALKDDRFGNASLRNQMAMECADRQLGEGAVTGAMAFVKRIPAGEVRSGILRYLAGKSIDAIGWANLDAEGLLELQREFAAWPEKELKGELIALLWKNLGEQFPERIAEVKEMMSPSERFDASLGILGIRSQRDSETPLPGEATHFTHKAVDGFASGEKVPMEAGLAAGMSREEVLQAMAPAVVSVAPWDKALAWLDEHRADLDMDRIMLAKLSTLGGPVSAWGNDDTPETRAIDCASRLSDPEQRLQVCRGAFRRLLIRLEGDVDLYLEKPGIPQDLLGEFRKIQSETP